MTKYEKLNYQADLCTIAAFHCMKNNKFQMYNVWLFKARALRAIAATMSVGEAMEAAK
jgi:hypothetical protein